MQVLLIVSESWPLTIMFIAICCTAVLLYFINWVKRAEQDDKAYRASQAMVVRKHDNAG